jgi:hypothetical protein
MSDQQKAFKKVLDSTEKGPAAAGTLKPHAEYVRAYRTFTEGCSPKLVKPYEQSGGAANKSNAFKLATVSQQGDIKFVYATTDKTNDATQLAYVATSSGGYKTITCGQAATMTRDLAPAYSTWLKDPANKDQAGSTVEGSSGEGDGDGKTSCAVEGLGWIICPVFNVLAKMVDETYKIVEDLLAVQPLTTTGASQGLYEAWQSMRNIANAAFVVVFLIVIYTQVTGSTQGTGIFSNYGVKKLLPRIILAAILVNSSYWLCAIAIDISNILGASLKGLLSNTQGSIIGSPEFSSNFSSGESGWQGIVGPVLAFSIVGVGGYLALGSIIVLLPTVLLAILTAFLVLTLRQALIVVLVAIAPFAFVAYLLPNTQEWFKRWLDLFKTMLLMYPLIAIVFGGSALASHIIMQGRPDSWTIQLMGASVAIIPLAITPVIMKTAGGLLNRFGGIVNNPNRGPIDALRKRAEATAGRIKNNRDIRAMDRPSWRSLRGAGLRSEMKRDQIQKRRDAKYQGLAYQGSAQGYTKRAHDEEKETKRQENEFEERDIQGQLDHMGLHADIRGRLLDSEFGRKVAEDTERGRREEAHMMNNRNAYQQMYDATQNRDAMRQESENEFGRTDLGRRVAQRSKVAGGDKAITEGEHEEAYLNSPDGTQQSRGKKLVDDAVKQREGELETLYLQDEEGRQARTQQLTANKRSTDEAKAVEGQAEIGYLRSDEGAAARAETIRIDTDAQTEQLNVRNAQTGSTVGRAQAQELKRVQGAEKIIGKEAEAAYAASAIGQVQNQVEAELGLEVGKRQAIVNADAGTAFATSAQGEALTVQAAAAESSRAAADKTTEALVSELKTEKGAQLHPEYATEAQSLIDGAKQTTISGERAASASRIMSEEHDEMMYTTAADGTKIPSAAAVESGGIDDFGAQRAVAAASARGDKRFSEATDQEKSTFSSATARDLSSGLEAAIDDPSISVERVAAMAGTVTGRKDVGAKLDTLRTLAKARRDAKAAGDTAKMQRVEYAQKQAYEDLKRSGQIPFGLGETSLAALENGTLETDVMDESISRIDRKLSVEKLASLKPEEISHYADNASSLADSQLNTLKERIEALRKSDRYKDDVKPEAAREHERILQAHRDRFGG